MWSMAILSFRFCCVYVCVHVCVLGLCAIFIHYCINFNGIALVQLNHLMIIPLDLALYVHRSSRSHFGDASSRLSQIITL